LILKHRHGYAIPLALCVASVTLLMGIAATQLTAGDLQNATQQYYQERARQVADYGLERCIVYGLPVNAASFNNGEELLAGLSGGNIGSSQPVRSGSCLLQSSSRTHSEDRVTVTIYDNTDGNLDEAASGCPVAVVPTGFQYWVAEGQARENGQVRGSARIGALVGNGDPMGAAGAQVQYLVNHASAATKFTAVDRSTGTVEAGEVMFATNSTLLRDGATAPLSLNSVDEIQGKVRIPVGKPDSWVDSKEPLPPGTINKQGGRFNVPDYAPPALQHYSPRAVGSAAGLGSTLPPGRYGRWELGANTEMQLSGAYHVVELVLDGSDSAQAALLHSIGPTRLFVDKITINHGGSLALRNGGSSAREFQLYFQPQQSRQNLKLQMDGGSAPTPPGHETSVLVVAPGYNLKVNSDANNQITGSFCCEELDLFFENSGVPKFVYDISANLSRRRAQDSGDGSGIAGGSTTGNAANPDGSTGGHTGGDEPEIDDGDNTRSATKNPDQTEPFILSKQPL
jgi:hypothetical protein